MAGKKEKTSEALTSDALPEIKQEAHQVIAECFLLEQAFIDNKVMPVAANFLVKSDTKANEPVIGEQTFKLTNPSVLYGFEQGKTYAFTVFEV